MQHVQTTLAGSPMQSTVSVCKSRDWSSRLSHNAWGTNPLRLLEFSFSFRRLVRFSNPGTIVPLNLLLLRSKDVRLMRVNSSSGRVPVNPLLLMSRVFNVDSTLIWDKMGPVKLFPLTVILSKAVDFTAERSWKSCPWKLLFLNSMALSAEFFSSRYVGKGPSRKCSFTYSETNVDNFDQSGNGPEIPLSQLGGASTFGVRCAMEGKMKFSRFDKNESSYGRVPTMLWCLSLLGGINIPLI